WVRCCWELRR
ncbi:nitroreductase family protein, partial [Vibrio parahaemolyticus V-223/04]